VNGKDAQTQNDRVEIPRAGPQKSAIPAPGWFGPPGNQSAHLNSCGACTATGRPPQVIITSPILMRLHPGTVASITGSQNLIKGRRTMSTHTCPWWLGYLLASPLRRLIESPKTRLAPYVREGMLVLEPGPGMGFFTLELARQVGPRGRVVAVDLQKKMLAGLRRRARRAGLADRIETRVCTPDDLGIGDLAGRIDLVVLFHMLHEVAHQEPFLQALLAALKPGGGVLIVEPRGHVSAEAFQTSLILAKTIGFEIAEPAQGKELRALLRRTAA
jgi:2-polyprenyl-3-methyl-5-hydroxy-6-metoxy-1,4-benzoquinol methylase